MSKKIKLPRRPVPPPTKPHKVKKKDNPKHKHKYDDYYDGTGMFRHWLEDY